MAAGGGATAGGRMEHTAAMQDEGHAIGAIVVGLGGSLGRARGAA